MISTVTMRVFLLFVLMTAFSIVKAQEPSPTGRGSCILQNNGWICEDGTSVANTQASTPEPTSAMQESEMTTTTVTITVEPSPTNAGQCHLHGDHWHCENESENSHEGHSHSGHDHSGHDHSGHSHVGHRHGPSEQYGCGLAPLEEYNLNLHIGSIFILLAASIAGVLVPEVMRWLRSNKQITNEETMNANLGYGPRTSNVIFALRFFGGGIILSTAFVHLVTHAMVYFSNSCIGELQYEAVPAAIMMAAVWMMIVVNFLIMRPLRRKVALAQMNQDILRSTNSQSSHESADRLKETQDELPVRMREADEEHLQSKLKLEESELTFLEAGIIVHSIVIGVTIGTSSGEGWIAFLIAILWHQFCEGLALASRIVLVPKLSTSKVWIMYIAFCLTTPLGIAIGIGVRQSFNGNDRTTLLTIGILTAISAGILLYSSFVQVIAHDFLQDSKMHNASWSRALTAIIFFTLGAIVMSVLGKWA